MFPSGAYISNSFDSVAQATGTFLKNSSHAVLNSHQYTYGRTDTNVVSLNLPVTSPDFTYDSNGNLLSDGALSYGYDDENELISIAAASLWKSEFAYDGKMRRRIRKEYTWQSGAWVLANEVRYIYDGNLVIQERDALNVPIVTYTRGKDLSGSLEEAGGIGGLLARTDDRAGTTASYHADRLGNVTMLINAQQVPVAKYLYDPFGNTLSSSGPLADANLYRFSSKEAHPNSGLSYYLYRYYSPNLQRWINRDPIAEKGGRNLYQFVGNSPLNGTDPKGLLVQLCRDQQVADDCIDKAKKDRDYTICEANRALDKCVADAERGEKNCKNACDSWPPTLRVGCLYSCDAFFSSVKAGCYAGAASVIAGAWIAYGTAEAACTSGATLRYPVGTPCPAGTTPIGIGY